MIKLTCATIVIGVVLFLASCSMFNGPPSVIYPDRIENPDAYQIQVYPD